VQVYAKSFGDFLTCKGVALQAKKGENSIKISLNKKAVAELGEEGYKLDVHENGVQLTANQAAGIFNGLQTLKQLFPTETFTRFPFVPTLEGQYIIKNLTRLRLRPTRCT